MTLTAATDKAKMQEVAPAFRPIVAGILIQGQGLLDSKDPGKYTLRIATSWRSPDTQAALYAKGREYDRATNRWRIVGRTVTNARPHESAHCVSTGSGQGAALAVDLWVILNRSIEYNGKSVGKGALLPDAHPAWSVIPCAAYVVAGDRCAIGAAFASIRGGDWPHVEVAGWREMVRGGVLIGG